MKRRPRVVVCGTGFGRVYLAGLAAAESGFELAGILARGSDRSKACAHRYGVPLFTRPDELPGDVDVACVVVGSASTGGAGAQLATSLMARGVHVLQEHPLHADELAGCLRAARAHSVHHRVNTHHVHVAPVRRFVAAARALLREQPAVFVDAATAFPVLYTLFDILGAALGRLRPWGLAAPAELPTGIRARTPLDAPFRSLDGVFAGIPLTLRVQHQLAPGEPDNHGHLWHRITIGVDGGNLTLVSSSGPVVWCVRPHLPRSASAETGFDRLDDAYLGSGTARVLGPSEAPTWSAVLTEQWPAAARRAVGELWDAVVRGEDPMAAGQYHLALCQLTRETTDRLGPVELIRRPAPRILTAEDLVAGANESEREAIG